MRNPRKFIGPFSLPGIVFLLLILAAIPLHGGWTAGAGKGELPDPYRGGQAYADSRIFTAGLHEGDVTHPDAWKSIPDGTALPERCPASDPRDAYDVQHYLLDVWLDLDEDVIGGAVTIRSVVTDVAIDSMILDLENNYNMISADSVILEGGRLGYVHRNDKVRIALDRSYLQGEEISLTVHYHGRQVAWGPLQFKEHGDPPVPLVYSMGWPDNSNGWWPCKDVLYDKVTAEIRMTIPVDTFDMAVASNGRLIEVVDNPDTTRTWIWQESYPITTYNICFSATNYDTIQGTYVGAGGDTLPILHFVYPEDRDKAVESFSNLGAMISVCEELFGRYPFVDEKYGMAELLMGGAMEHQTMTSYGDFLITGDHTYDFVILHELAHHWFGNMITIGTWPDIWLSEGFASYVEALYEESISGLEGYLAYMTAFDRNDFDDTVYDPDFLLSVTVYQKGAWILHMLRHIMGEGPFFEALATFAADPGFMYGNAVTADFIALCESFYGGDLGWYFDPWLNEVGRPVYRVDWNAEEADSGYSAEVRIDQTQLEEVLYKMPLPLVFVTASGKTTVTVWDSLRTQTFSIHLPAEPLGMELDPDNWVLKTIEPPAGIGDDPPRGDGIDLPRAFRLHPNYPNPFNPMTTIEFEIPGDGGTGIRAGAAEEVAVSLRIYDVRGRLVRTLIDEAKEPGAYQVAWDGSDSRGRQVGSGVYIYRLRAGDRSVARKMLLAR